MPVRHQHTPYGDVTLTSRWKRDHYILRACGPELALRWLFPNVTVFEQRSNSCRHSFEPTPNSLRVTVERELRQICQRLQAVWDEKLQDFQENQSDPHADKGQASAIPLVPRTLGELIAHLGVQRRRDLSPKTEERDKHYLGLWTKALGTSLPLASVTEDLLRTHRDHLAKRLKPSTVNCSFAVLKTHFNYAHAKGYMSTLPHKLIKPLKDTRSMRDVPWWTVEDVELALKCAAQDHHQPTAVLLIAVGCMAGLRFAELSMQRWQDIEIDAVNPRTREPVPVLHVVGHDGWVPKNGRNRTIPLNARLAQILREHRKSSGYLLMPEAIKHSSAPPRPRKEGGKRTYRYDFKNVWNRIITLVQAAGGKRITVHGMRHSFTSHHLICDVRAWKVAQWLGHADTTMIDERYGHLMGHDRSIDAVSYPTGDQ
jgi:integrase